MSLCQPFTGSSKNLRHGHDYYDCLKKLLTKITGELGELLNLNFKSYQQRPKESKNPLS
jgi:hypothetical protein